MQQTDQQVFLQKMERHKGMIYKVSRMYMDCQDDQDDLFQEIAYQLWKSYSSFKGDSQFSTWMYRVAINTAISFFKKDKKLSRQATRLTDLENSVADDFSTHPADDQLAHLHRAVHHLNEIEKALIFFYLEGFSHAEIGRNLGISEGNARVKLNRTKTKLQEIIKKQGYEF